MPSGYAKTPLVDTFAAYPDRLHHALKERFPYAVINVIVTGIGGENSVRGEKRFADEVLTHRPDVVVIDYALNDRGIGLSPRNVGLGVYSLSDLKSCERKNDWAGRSRKW